MKSTQIWESNACTELVFTSHMYIFLSKEVQNIPFEKKNTGFSSNETVTFKVRSFSLNCLIVKTEVHHFKGIFSKPRARIYSVVILHSNNKSKHTLKFHKLFACIRLRSSYIVRLLFLNVPI